MKAYKYGCNFVDMWMSLEEQCYVFTVFSFLGGLRSFVEALFTNMADDPDELSFDKGDVLQVTQVINDEWFLCSHRGQQGMVPANYVKLVDHPPS